MFFPVWSHLLCTEIIFHIQYIRVCIYLREVTSAFGLNSRFDGLLWVRLKCWAKQRSSFLPLVYGVFVMHFILFTDMQECTLLRRRHSLLEKNSSGSSPSTLTSSNVYNTCSRRKSVDICTIVKWRMNLLVMMMSHLLLCLHSCLIVTCFYNTMASFPSSMSACSFWSQGAVC